MTNGTQLGEPIILHWHGPFASDPVYGADLGQMPASPGIYLWLIPTSSGRGHLVYFGSSESVATRISDHCANMLSGFYEVSVDAFQRTHAFLPRHKGHDPAFLRQLNEILKQHALFAEIVRASRFFYAECPVEAISSAERLLILTSKQRLSTMPTLSSQFGTWQNLQGTRSAAYDGSFAVAAEPSASIVLDLVGEELKGAAEPSI
jgi:hypothetical protein